ncbi:glycosyltransferase family 4 protein [Plantactinospora siamensis]|uniref:Glycosyltransferase family 4 protein n=1 Tax=Plantactinospora siamensis TaxID=555372 RepID=A0ABV6P2R9_9ACTN
MTARLEVTPRRIALLSHGIDGGGGVPEVARWLLDGLRSLGHRVDLHDLAGSRVDPYSRRLTRPRSWTRPSLRAARTEPVPHDHWGADAVEVEVMRYRPRPELTRALRGYDLVQVVAGAPAWAAPALSAGRPVILQVASTVRWEREDRPRDLLSAARLWRQGMTVLTSRVERRVLRRVAAVLTENGQMFEHVRGVGQRHVRLAPPGIDVDLFAPDPAGWRRQGPLLSVCRLNDPRKGLDRMIHAYAAVRQRLGPDRCPPLVLAGQGPVPEALPRLIGQLGLAASIDIRVDVPRNDLGPLYRAASVFLQTSYEEGLGLSVLQAMASGLPVVSTDSAGARQLVRSGLTGWLVPQRPAVDLPGLVAERTIDLLTGPGGQFGARGRAWSVEHYSAKRALEPFLETFDEVLGRAMRPGALGAGPPA